MTSFDFGNDPLPSTGAPFGKGRLTEQRQAIVNTARALVGVRFRHQGRRPASGLDCVGVAAVICHTLDIAYRDRLDYPRRPAPGALWDGLVAAGFMRSDTPARPGDLLLMRIHGDIQHVGILTGSSLVHAFAPARRVVEHGLRPPWTHRVAGHLLFPTG